jgi:hypothetical protein
MLLRPKVALFELGDESQARRVLGRLFQRDWAELLDVEVWRDWPDLSPDNGEATELVVDADGTSRTVVVKGSGQVRAILLKMQLGS